MTIVSSDKDLMQLVRPGVRMYDTMKNKVIGEDEVMERFGVPPAKVIEVQALIGDPTDNVPGVPGIGVKTAALLINEYGDLDTLLARASEITQPKRRESLITFADQARLSRTLVILDTHVPLDVPLAETLVRQPEAETLLSFMRRLEFSTLLRRIADGLGVEAPAGAAPAPKQPRKRGEVYDHPLRKLPAGGFVAERTEPVYPAKEGSPLHLAEERAAMLSALPFDRSKYETVVHPERLAVLLDAAREQGHVAFRAKVTSSDPMQGELVGIALSLRPGTAVYIPLGHRVSDGLDLGGEGEVKQMKTREALDLLKPLLEDESVLKIVQNAKFDMVVLARYGIALTGFDDPCLMSYALDAGRAEHLPEQLAGALLSYTCLTHKEIMGTGRAAVTFERVPVARATEFAGEEADIGLRLWLVLKPRLIAEHVDTVYETLERPIAPVLALMERTGIRVERARTAQATAEDRRSIVQNAKFDMVRSPARHRAHRLRRSLPHVLCLDAAAPSICPSSLPAAPRLYLPHAEGDHGHRPRRRHLRARACRPRHRICRRGSGHRPQALARAEAEADRRACRHRLRDLGAADRAGAGADGADRHQGRARDARQRSPAPSRRASRGSKTRSGSLPARTSTSARRSSSARSCSTR